MPLPRVTIWFRSEAARVKGVRALISGLALTVTAAAALLPPFELPERGSTGPGPDTVRGGDAARRLREESVERRLAAVRGVRGADLQVAGDDASVVVALSLEPGRPLAAEARAAIVRLVCDAFPGVIPRRVLLIDAGPAGAAGRRRRNNKGEPLIALIYAKKTGLMTRGLRTETC